MLPFLLAFTVMLDPGHGGSNVGASGVLPGIYEKRLTLELAQLVRRRLEGHGVRVLLTRSKDVHLPIRERVRQANRSRPDLFLSLHLNASDDRTQRGTEAFVLGPAGIQLDLRRRGDHARRRAQGGARGEAAALRAEHALLEARKQALRLAQLLQERVTSALADSSGTPRELIDRGVRQAEHDVLLGVDVPAVLLELAFIDHPIEGRELLRPRVQADLADAVARSLLEVARKAEAPAASPATERQSHDPK